MIFQNAVQPIAVIGMGCVLPNSMNVDGYWQLLRSGDRSAQGLPPENRWDWTLYHNDRGDEPDKGYSPLGGYIRQDGFNPGAIGVDASFVDACGWMERWLIQSIAECRQSVVKRGLREVAFVGGSMDGTHGQRETVLTFTNMMRAALVRRGAVVPEDLEDRCNKALEASYPEEKVPTRSISGQARFAVRLILGNDVPCQVLDAACASSLFSVEHGVRALRDGSADLAWCGGFFKWGPIGQVLFSTLGGLTKNACTPFDQSADGTIFGDGAGVIALKRLADAERDGEKILGVVRGIGTASDGRGKSAYAPNRRGQILAMQRSLADANLQPKDIDYVIAHATGTPVGDATEYSSLIEVYGGEDSRGPGEVFLGSNKGNFGHLGWTAGTASIIHALLVFREKQIPPQAGFQQAQGGIDLEQGPFRIAKEITSLPLERDQPLRIAVSGFGFGGTNAHILLEEYTEKTFPSIAGHRYMNPPKCQTFCVVAWSAMLPGALGREVLEDKWSEGVAGRFSEPPYFEGIRFRMPPPTQRLADPAQLLLLRATDDLLSQLPKEIVDQFRSHTGVFVASTGGGQMWVSHAMRIQRDLMRRNLSSDHQLQPVLEDVIEEALARFPKSGEDSFPGIMPNLLAGRIANIFDLHGLNEVIDADVRSFLSALEIACRALSHEDLICALVGGCTPIAMDAIAPCLTEGDEGVGMVALVREETATRLNLPVVATLRLKDSSADPLDSSWDCSEADRRIGTLPNLAGLPEMLFGLARRKEVAFSLGNDGFLLGDTAQKSDRLRRPDPCKVFQACWSSIPLPARVSPHEPIVKTLVLPTLDNQEFPSKDNIFRLSLDARELSTARQVETFLNHLNQFTSTQLKNGYQPSFLFEIYHGWCNFGPSALMSAIQSWIHSYSKEEPAARLFLLASESETLPKDSLLLWWDQASQGPVVCAWEQDRGWRSQMFLETSLSPSASANPLGSESVILVLGGSSGIGLVTARQLARRHGSTVILVGRSKIVPDEWYPEPLPSEGLYFQQTLARQAGKIDIKKSRRLYRNLCAKREKYINLTALARSGIRFTYEQCDVTDPTSVCSLVSRLHSAFGSVDGVIYSVIDPDLNLDLLRNFDEKDFLKLWRSKAVGLENILSALLKNPPKLIVNASSISTLGLKGLVSYSAANAYQGSLLSEWSRAGGARVINIGWPGWGESGISHRIDPSQANAVAETTFLSDKQGAEYVDRIISDHELRGNLWLLGEGERKQFNVNFQDLEQQKWIPGPPELPFVDEILIQGSTTWIKCTFSIDRDGWLDGHLIGEDPVVPGTGLLELVAESVSAAVPDKAIVSLLDVNFRRFVKLSKSRPLTLYVVVVQSGQSTNLYHVDIHSDLLDGHGKILQFGRHHLSSLVETCRPEEVVRSPHLEFPQVDEAKWFRVCEPYLAGAAGISLGGVFDTLDDLKTSATQAQGVYRCHLGNANGKLSGAILPFIFLDGALRLAALCPDDSGDIPVFAPVYLKRLRLYQAGGDSYWSSAAKNPVARYLFSQEGLTGSLQITGNDGQVIISAEGLAGHLLGKQPWISPNNLQLPPLVRSVQRQSAYSLEVSVPIDPQKIPHLFTSAQLHNHPVLPGSWQMAIAAEVAGMFRPGWAIAAITDQTFASALKLRKGWEAPLRVKANIIVDAIDHCVVNCQLVSDIIHSNGTVLQRDRLHGSLNVRLQTSLASVAIKPLPFNADSAETNPWIPEILYWPNSHLRLGQGFTAICDTRYDGHTLQCRYRNPASIPDLLSQLRLPPLLLDAMLQPLLPMKGRIVGTGIPKRIGAVRFAMNFNEYDIREKWCELLIRSQGDTDSNQPISITVSSPDGTQGLIHVEDFETYSLGAIDVPSGLALPDSSSESLRKLIKEHPDYAMPNRIRRVWEKAVIYSKGRRQPIADGRMARVALGDSCVRLLSAYNIPTLTTAAEDIVKLATYLEAGLDRLEIHLDDHSVTDYANKTSWKDLSSLLSELHTLSQLFLNRPCLLVQVVVHQVQHTSGLAHSVMGWVRALAKDFASNERDLCRCWLVEGLNPSLIISKLAQDASIRLPVSDSIQWQSPNGVRVMHLLQERAVSSEHCPLSSDATFFITGGTGGIGLAVADALHRRYGCRLILVGRTAAAPKDAVLPDREKFLLDFNTNMSADKSSIGTAIHAYEKLLRSIHVRDSLASLQERGANVQFYAVDLEDPGAVGDLIADILRQFGKVDCVLHLAGIESSSETLSKSQSDFQSVLAAKVASSLNLYQAFNDVNLIPDLWVHGSSIMATFGIPGATDYCAANAWLEGFHLYLCKQHPGCRSLLIEWTAWGGTGMLAKRPGLWDRTRLWTGQRIGPEMGARLLIQELESIESGPSPILVVHPHPVKLDYEPERLVTMENKPLFLDQIQTLGSTGWEGVCHLTPERHRQLSAHTTDGIPSLPGSFELALAIDLLRQALPVWKLAELRNVDYTRFVKVPLNSVLPVRIRARLLRSGDSELVLGLELVSDFVHRTGRIIDPDRVHWSAECLLRQKLTAPPSNVLQDLLEPVPPYQDVQPAHYKLNASIAYTKDVHSLHRRQIDANGHAWGQAFLSGWEVRHPILPTLIGADAMALTPCLGDVQNPIVHVNNRTSVIYFYEAIESVGTTGSLTTHAWPAEDFRDGNFCCPRLEVRNANNELVVLAINAWFLAYDKNAFLSSSAAFVRHHSAT